MISHRTTMTVMAALLAAVALAQALEVDPRLAADTSLLSAPDGFPAGTLREGMAVQVLERRDGWLRVQVEGWVPADSLVRAEAAPTEAVLTGAAAMAATGGGTGELEGLIRLQGKWGRKQIGEDLEVLLLPGRVEIDELLASNEEEQRAEIAELDVQVKDLERRIIRAMQGPSLMESNREADSLEAQKDELLGRRNDLLASLHGRHQAAARELAGSMVVSDSRGWFRFASLGAGEYTVYARLTAGDSDVEWLEPVQLPGGGTVRVDLDCDSARDLLEKK